MGAIRKVATGLERSRQKNLDSRFLLIEDAEARRKARRTRSQDFAQRPPLAPRPPPPGPSMGSTWLVARTSAAEQAEDAENNPHWFLRVLLRVSERLRVKPLPFGLTLSLARTSVAPPPG